MAWIWLDLVLVWYGFDWIWLDLASFGLISVGFRVDFGWILVGLGSIRVLIAVTAL